MTDGIDMQIILVARLCGFGYLQIVREKIVRDSETRRSRTRRYTAAVQRFHAIMPTT